MHMKLGNFFCYTILTTFLHWSLCSFTGHAQETGRETFPGREKWSAKEKPIGFLGADDYHFSLSHRGIIRKYNVHIPPGYDKNRSMPAVIYLHGGGGSIRSAYNDGVDKAAEKFGFILIIPNDTGPIPDRLLTWNGGKWDNEQCCGYASDNNIDDVGFIAKMIEEVVFKFSVDKNRIYATGISNGGLMSYRLACELSNKIAAIAPVASPATPSACEPLRAISVMHIHGTADPCAPFNGGNTGKCIGVRTYSAQSVSTMVGAWQKTDKCSANLETIYQKGKAVCKRYTGCQDGSDVELCTVEGMGHVWPSGWQYFSAERIGPVSYDLSFDQIWDFFKSHPMK